MVRANVVCQPGWQFRKAKSVATVSQTAMASSSAMPELATPQLPERFGRRVASLRSNRGWSQSELAEHLAMSRTAVSHLEACMRDASERTVIVLAGLFHLEPHELVDGTDYPRAKAERLPINVARYTEADFLCALALQDQSRASALGGSGRLIVDDWIARLVELSASTFDPHESQTISTTLRRLRTP